MATLRAPSCPVYNAVPVLPVSSSRLTRMFVLKPSDSSANSYVKISLEVYNRIYQKGLTKTQIGASCPQVLTGQLVLSVFKPVNIRDIQVSWMGESFETVHVAVKDPEVPTSVRYSKRIDKRSLVHDCIHFEESCLPAGIYTYDFNFVVDPFLPESMMSRYITNKYYVKVDVIHQAGSSVKQVSSKSDVQLIRSVPEDFSPFSDPIVATGNWRNKLIYEFDLQTKIAFQKSKYCATVGIYPVGSFHDFRIYSMTIVLLQQILYDIVNEDSPKRHIEVQKLALHHQEFTSEEMYACLAPEGYFKFTAKFDIPSLLNGVDDQPNIQPKTMVHPSFNHNSKSGFSISHNIKASFEVGEVEPKLSRRASEETLFEDEPLSKRSPSETTLSSLSSKSNSSYVVPSYRAFHDSREDVTRYKKVELSYSSPITILNPSARDTITPPKYSASPKLIENLTNLTQKCLKHFKTKSKVSQIVPPMYSEKLEL